MMEYQQAACPRCRASSLADIRMAREKYGEIPREEYERALTEATDADADICDAASLVYSVSCSIDAESRAVSLRFSGTCRECQFSIVFDHEHTFDPWSS